MIGSTIVPVITGYTVRKPNSASDRAAYNRADRTRVMRADSGAMRRALSFLSISAYRGEQRRRQNSCQNVSLFHFELLFSRGRLNGQSEQ
jgi:hypothetical protein